MAMAVSTIESGQCLGAVNKYLCVVLRGCKNAAGLIPHDENSSGADCRHLLSELTASHIPQVLGKLITVLSAITPTGKLHKSQLHIHHHHQQPPSQAAFPVGSTPTEARVIPHGNNGGTLKQILTDQI